MPTRTEIYNEIQELKTNEPLCFSNGKYHNFFTENFVKEQEVQELKDRLEKVNISIEHMIDNHSIEIKRLQQWSDNWKDSAQKKILEIEKLQKELETFKAENAELKEQIEELKSKLEHNSDKELLKILEQEEKRRKKYDKN